MSGLATVFSLSYQLWHADLEIYSGNVSSLTYILKISWEVIFIQWHSRSIRRLGCDNFTHPKLETIAEYVKRQFGMSVGVITTAEVQDATAAAVWAHTHNSDAYGEKPIVLSRLSRDVQSTSKKNCTDLYLRFSCAFYDFDHLGKLD